MADIEVSHITVPTLIEKLKSRNWLIPKFQREFIWTISQIIDLVHSIIEARPIGMASIWEQSNEPTIELEAISIKDYDSSAKKTNYIHFQNTDKNSNKCFAVLDGRQRCTAIAMAFGGFHSKHNNYKYSGRFFLNVAEKEPGNRVVFYKEKQIISKGFDTDANCISEGLFPLSSNVENEEMMAQWMRYIQAIKDPQFYQNGKVPEESELQRRNDILKNAFNGIVKTKLAVYSLPETYTLPEICEIFETLNTSGTKVSAVDLIHSWLYSDTIHDPKPIHLRDWIDDIGQREGAIGWASTSDRPELIIQTVTACHIALENKPEPRPIGKGRANQISSLKSSDLLGTPSSHWKTIIENEDLLIQYLGNFQKTVAGGSFNYKICPYPVTITMYVSLRWHHKFDDAETHEWGIEELDALFSAFFWRNALTNRYEQGFLTKIGNDIKKLKEWLNKRKNFESSSSWATAVQKLLDNYIPGFSVLNRETLIDLLTDDRPGGAIQNALTLKMITATSKDFINPTRSLSFSKGEKPEMHHIYPLAWCRNNKAGELVSLLDQDIAGRNWVNSLANMMPLSRTSNNMWKAKVPKQIIEEKKISFSSIKEILKASYINEELFKCLASSDQKNIGKFWEKRAELMADDILKNLIISL